MEEYICSSAPDPQFDKVDKRKEDSQSWHYDEVDALKEHSGDSLEETCKGSGLESGGPV